MTTGCGQHGASSYPPVPCQHTGQPDIGTAIHDTASTGADVTVASITLMFLLLVAALALVVSHALRRDA